MIFDENYTYAIAIRKNDMLNNYTYKQYFDHNEFYPILFNSDGYYYDINKPSGMYKFCEPEELREIADKFSLPITSNCPFVGEVLGYCLIQPWIFDDFLFLIEQALYPGNGFIARLNDGLYFDIVAEKELTLREATDRHGFGEGSIVLLETDSYNMYLRDSISKSLESIGIKSFSFSIGDHNHILNELKDNSISNWIKFDKNADKIILKLWVLDWEGLNEFKTKLSLK